jgi:predicted RNase H-like HicB family nuclease
MLLVLSSNNLTMIFQILIQRDEDGIYIASCPAIMGCHTQGDTYEEALENIKEAIEVNIEHKKHKDKSLIDEYNQYPKYIATEELSIAA